MAREVNSFNFDDKVRDALLNEGLGTLEEFRFFFDEEKAIKTFIDGIRELQKPMLQKLGPR